MSTRSAALSLCAALALTHPPGLGAEEIARVLGVVVDRSELSAAGDGPAAELGRLYDRVWTSVSRHYIEQSGLNATREEMAEVLGYEREFERRDRAQRVRKLEELTGSLPAGSWDSPNAHGPKNSAPCWRASRKATWSETGRRRPTRNASLRSKRNGSSRGR